MSKPVRPFDIACPTCLCGKGERCRDDEGNFTRYHRIRFELALASNDRGSLSDELYEDVVEFGGYSG